MFELPAGSYSISNIQDYFNIYEKIILILQQGVYINKTENKIRLNLKQDVIPNF